MIRSYNIILANKLDNDILVERRKSDESNIRKLNKKNSTPTSMTIRKIKCNNKESVIPLVQKSLKINTSAKKPKKHDGNKEINTLIKNNTPTNDTNDDNNKKTNVISNTKDNNDGINKFSIDLMSCELFFIFYHFCIFNIR